jgi:sulfur carrier protein
MIKLNHRNCEWIEGLTVKELLKIKKYTFPQIIVSINGKFIDTDDYVSTPIFDENNVLVIHLMAGG